MSLPLIMMPAAALALAESLMADSASWSRAGAVVTPLVVDPVTGLMTGANPDVVVYVGPCRRYSRILPRTGQLAVSAGDAVVGVLTYISVSLSAPSLRIHDVGLITACPARPDDVGLRYRVINLVKNTQASAQRVQVEAVID